MVGSTPISFKQIPLILLCLGMFAGCATTQSAKGGNAIAPCQAEKQAAASPKARTGVTSRAQAEHESLLDQVPSSARAALIIRQGALQFALSLLDRPPAMRADLARFLIKTVGLDLTRITGLVAFATRLAPSSSMALLVRLDGSTKDSSLKGRVLGRHHGVDLVAVHPALRAIAARVPGGVVLGQREAVLAAVDLAHGRLDPLDTKSLLAPMLEADNMAVDLLAGLHAPSVPQLTGATAQFGIQDLTLSLDDEMLITLAARGDPTKLNLAQTFIRAAMAQALGAQEARMQQALAGQDIFNGIANIIGTHQLQAILSEVEPRLEGDRLVARYSLPRLSLSSGAPVVALTGILAAVAIPSFIKYIRKSKAAEARINLKQLQQGLETYWVEHGGKRAAFRFPPSTPWTPADSCCSSGQSQKCTPDASTFSHPSFKALGFQLAAPHYFQYRMTSTGKGKRASVTIEARADLDCNGTFSAYRLNGGVKAAQGNFELSFGELAVENELE